MIHGFNIGQPQISASLTDTHSMTVASASQFAQAQVAADISLRVGVKAKDVVEQQGEAAISLLESAANLSQSLAGEPGKGVHLDVTG